MNVIKVKNYEELSAKAFEVMKSVLNEKPNAVLGLATGSSPIGLYQKMVQDHKDNKTSYSEVVSFNLDEYVGLPKTHSESYYTFMHTHLFDHVDIKEDNIHIPDGLANDLETACAKYEQEMKQFQVDVQLLGIGSNGHIGFNEPGCSFESETHVELLNERTLNDNARFFIPLNEEVPTRAVTMGIASIMRAKKILLVASGANKAQAIYDMIHHAVDNQIPATILQNHADVTVIVDEEAASLL